MSSLIGPSRSHRGFDRSPARRAAAGIALALLACVLAGGSAEARNPIRQSFFGAYPSAVGSRLDNLPSLQGHCGVCHYAFTGGGQRNLYGQRVEQALPNFPNTDAGRQQAIHSIENLDSDGDGYTQLVEITDLINFGNTPTFPGLTPSNVGQVSGIPLAEITPYLVPVPGSDTQAPVVAVTSPDGSESWTAGTAHSVTWTATDNVGVTSVDVYYRDGATAPWTLLAPAIANSGSLAWFVHNTPTGAARVRVVARDAAANAGEDQSNGDFTILIQPGGIVPTTLRDFHQPGTQPFGAAGFQSHTDCAACHGGYDPAVEPDWNFMGSMMAQAGRDPLFYACLAVAEQDAPSAGDLCLRCHTAFGWLGGRSNPTDGSQLLSSDLDGVSCDLCHRMVDPDYQPGISPPEDQAVLDALPAGDLPVSYTNGQFVVDPNLRRRGPFADVQAPHPFLHSPFHRTAEFCGTCHDVSNPAFLRTGEADYAPGPLDERADSITSTSLMPLERTFSEWRFSAFPAGVYAPEFAGNKPDGIVAICQDCHLRDVSGKGCNDPNAPVRADLPLHDMTGGNSWLPGLIDDLYPGDVDPAALAAGAARAVSMLQLAATLDLTVADEADSFRATVVVTNRTGHKLPTGYPEGRRMWIHLTAYDEEGALIRESGAYDASTGVLAREVDAMIYEAELGLSPGLAGALGLSGGPSFHFALNDTVYKDNRIPPMGFTNAGFASFGGKPVDPEQPGTRYADGQNWDTASYPLPAATRRVRAVLRYQTTSKEYVEFLRDENHTNGSGDLMHQLWADNGRAAPVVMAADSTEVAPGAAPEEPPAVVLPRLSLGPVPFTDRLAIRLDLPAIAAARIEVFDPRGRILYREEARPALSHRLQWNGRDLGGRDLSSGSYWIRVQSGDRTWERRILRIR